MIVLESIFASSSLTAASFTIPELIVCTLFSLLLGVCVAYIYMREGTYTKSFVVTLALLPAMVQIVIILVNGNLGTGVAVMGAFGLIRFRSVPGTAREISSIFFAMALGIATGMGYLGYAALFFVLVGGAMLLLGRLPFGTPKGDDRILKITVPENLDYEGMFDDLLAQYTTVSELQQVRTAGMGSVYELSYRICLRQNEVPKEFIDAIRCRNGNLNIICARVSTGKNEL